jgi:uncharacterized membrane protein YfcA
VTILSGAVLAAFAFTAATLAAVTGFGGAAVLLPPLVLIFGARDAVPILTVAQLIGNGSRVWFNRGGVDFRVVAWYALGAVPFAVAGGYLFALTPLSALTRGLGVFLIAVVAWRRLHHRPMPRPPLRSFAIIGAVASFLSALVGSVGPLMAPLFLAYGLIKGAYIGTEALATVVTHVAKLAAYHQTATLPASSIAIGLALGPLMIAGSFAGKQIVDRLPERAFVIVIEATMVGAGLLFAIQG